MRLRFSSIFKPFPFCPKGSPSVQVNGPDGEIKCAQSLIPQEGLQQFSDHDRARARATYSMVLTEYAKRIALIEAKGYHPRMIAKILRSEGIFVSRRGVAKFYQEYTQLTCLLLLGLE